METINKNVRIAISAESTIDMPKDLLAKYGIDTVPFTVLLGDKAKLDGEMDPSEIFEYVFETNKLPKTSAVNEYQYAEHFKTLLKENDYVIHFSLSSEMSSAYRNACSVAKRMGNVYVIDTRSLSTGIALLAIYACKLLKKLDDPKEIVRIIKNRIPYVQASFVLGRLDYLHKGGRCNALALLGSSLLRIKPQIVVSEGKMMPKKKFMGNMEQCVNKYYDATFEMFDNPDLDEVFITYTTAKDSTVTALAERLKAKGFKNIHITHAGCTISSHCGEQCLGILYINDGNIDIK